MKFGQSIEYNKRNLFFFFFFKNHGVNEVVGGLVRDFFLYEVKASDVQLCFNFF